MNVIWLDTIDSTNTEALRRLPELQSGTVLAAREQTAGRGQRGNSWFSEPGKNLTFSIVLKFEEGQLSAADTIWLNYLISVTVVDFLQSHAIWCKVKWPNDVYVGRNKICGILIENVLKGSSVAAAVIGVGLNINQKEFPQLANATSLWSLTGKEHPVDNCLEKLMEGFEQWLPYLSAPEGRSTIFSHYSTHLFNLDVNARYHDYLTDREYIGIIKGVAPDGRLMIWDLEAPGKPMRYYSFKEVGYIL
ncbi:MAG: biotin--[Bacteroidales bacterium]|nr:biotin--[acetyl-CoA-carboxylase] ligase [Bacteroidales bacterium]